MKGYLSNDVKSTNLHRYLSSKNFTLSEIFWKVQNVIKCKAAYIGGSIIYGIDNIYSDIDVLVIVDESEGQLPAQLTQLDIKGVRADCRTIAIGRVNASIENIINKATIIADNKNPFRIGLKSEEHEALDRIANGINIHENFFQVREFYNSLALVLTFDRINDFFGIYQDAVGALLSNQLYYSYTRTLECAAKVVDIFLSANGYINESVKSRVVALDVFYPEEKITAWYKNLLADLNIGNNAKSALRSRLREMSLMILDLQLKKFDMIEAYNGK
ncbi:hypothetical protein ACQ3G7_07800 [Kosakonia oryzendophytica]|uniref:hypothetical protein n=1 Tax=Kosakonia oryzendophytica TaxID=1005665 RepID=UPI003D352C77